MAIIFLMSVISVMSVMSIMTLVHCYICDVTWYDIHDSLNDYDVCDGLNNLMTLATAYSARILTFIQWHFHGLRTWPTVVGGDRQSDHSASNVSRTIPFRNGDFSPQSYSVLWYFQNITYRCRYNAIPLTYDANQPTSRLRYDKSGQQCAWTSASVSRRELSQSTCWGGGSSWDGGEG